MSAYEQEQGTFEYEKKEPSKGQAYGVASVTNAMHGVSLPVSKQDLINRFGNREIHWTKNSSQRLGELLQNVPQEHFNSVTEIASSISQVVKGRSGPPVRY